MMNFSPLVSVSMLTYNHEQYIGEALRSILDQTFSDLEVIVVDDGSTDSTPQVVAALSDPRIVYLRQENQGPSAAANRAYRACRGRYIALMSGDDVCYPDRIERQLAEYRRGERRLLFSAINLIDDEGRPLSKPSFCEDNFAAGPMSQAEICHRFFHQGNFINAITGFTETEVMQRFGQCDPRLLQLQDFDLWVRLLKRYEIHVNPEPTLCYRIRNDGQNLSAPNRRQSLGCANELYFIMRRFFEGLDPARFREAFGRELLRPECLSPVEIACEQAFLFLRSRSPVHRLLGVEKIHELLENPTSAEVLREHYHFDSLAFIKLLGAVEPFSPLSEWRTTLYLDLGSGFRERDAYRAEAEFSENRFAIAFDVTGTPQVRQMRWDPCEGRLCRVRIEEMVWHTPEGDKGVVDLAEVTANGTCGVDGTYTFETTDPMFLIPFRGNVSRFSIRGSWEVQSLEASLGRFPALLAERQTLLERVPALLAERQMLLERVPALLAERDTLQLELKARRAELAELERQVNAILTSRRWRLANKVHSLWRALRGKRAA
jgi:glycosyltransferase involved in cell wall biosynthesis